LKNLSLELQKSAEDDNCIEGLEEFGIQTWTGIFPEYTTHK